MLKLRGLGRLLRILGARVHVQRTSIQVQPRQAGKGLLGSPLVLDLGLRV